MRYRQALTIPIALRPDTAQPLHEQIAGQIAAAIRSGAVPGGARVPSTRTLADLLGVSRGVVALSYDVLRERGFLVTRPGSGTFVRAAPAAVRAEPEPRRLAKAAVADLRPGQLCAEAFPLQAWRAAWRQASYHLPAAEPPPLGMPALRQAIAEHLARQHGVVAPGHEVMVTAGLAAGLRLLASQGIHFGAVETLHEGSPRVIDIGPSTVLAGGFCEVLTPSLKLGYLVVPKELAPRLDGQPPSGPTQAAVTQLLRDGTIERQSRRLARLYAAKAAIVAEVLGPLIPVRPGVAVLPVPDAARAAQCLHRNGILVHTQTASNGRPEALVFGFGHLCDTTLRETLKYLLLSLREEGP